MSTLLILFVLLVTIFLVGITLLLRFQKHEPFIDTILSSIDLKQALMKRTFCENKQDVVNFLNNSLDDKNPIHYNPHTKQYEIVQGYCES